MPHTPNQKQPTEPWTAAMRDRFASAINTAPLGVLKEDQSYRSIPASSVPLIIPDQEWTSLRKDCHLIHSGMGQLLSWFRANWQSSHADQLFQYLSPAEKLVAQSQEPPPTGLATARMDLFFDGDSLKVIEVNSTIPAMQAYSDMVFQAYLSGLFASYQLGSNSVGTNRSLDLPMNSLDLLNSLLAHYQIHPSCRSKNSSPRIAIVARPQDSQTAELLWLQARWLEQGIDCVLATPNDIKVGSDHRLQARNKPVDLIYRHIFVHRLEAGSDFLKACLRPAQFPIYNPVSAHLEVKGFLAELSRAADEGDNSFPNLKLPEAVLHAIQNRVPWSRLLVPQETLVPGSSSKEKLVPWVIENQADIVLKNNDGYGGHRVLIGSEFEQDKNQLHMQKLLEVSKNLSWEEVITRCSMGEGGTWIVQKKIPGRQMNHHFCDGDKWHESRSFVDCSIFTNSGTDFQPTGGACRFANSTIVNIGTGGGVAPLMSSRIFDQIQALNQS